ncbi:thiamine-binding protein [Carnobacteriaceae bacterium zg-ZUI252]|nr:thiamine-binding protein [Carnobacteriaceae bacterium zg-ZUI252]MBS4770210.1 thiamine-binding protein [Carnobacteriaceae bacterium zg-ZUI240]
MNCSIALQILPLTHPNRIVVIDDVIAFLQSQENVRVQVTPFETVLEGDFDTLMTILKDAISLAGKECDNIFANVKINYGNILSIDEKLEKFSE